MKLIIWLWNPWNEYKNTRHNIWFMFLDYFSEKNKFGDFELDKKFNLEMSSWFFNWEKTFLIKPMTYMNLSWQSILKIMSFYKIVKDDIIVISDDVSMGFWKVRFREKWSHGGHNWLRSIIENIWENFKRIKIWVWNNTNYELSSWVLSKFTEEEINMLNEVYDKAEKILNEKI